MSVYFKVASRSDTSRTSPRGLADADASTGSPRGALLFETVVPPEWIEYGVHGDLIMVVGNSIFYLLQGGYRSRYMLPSQLAPPPCRNSL